MNRLVLYDAYKLYGSGSISNGTVSTQLHSDAFTRKAGAIQTIWP
jgi:hypothetical protein